MPLGKATEFRALSAPLSRPRPVGGVRSTPATRITRKAVETDVLVIGAGIAGLTAALLLARAGKKVTVLPAERERRGPSTALGLLMQRVGLGYAPIVRMHGLEVARALASSTYDAMTTVREFGRLMGGCGYQRIPGYLFSEREEDLAALREESDCARAAGVKTEVSRTIPLPFRVAGAVRFPGQAQFVPSLYLNGLRRLAPAAGIVILPRARIESFVEGEPCVLQTSSELEVRASSVFLAAQQPFLKFPFLADLLPRRRQLLEIVRDDNFPSAICWDWSASSLQMHLAVRKGTRTLTIGSDDRGPGPDQLLGYASTRMGGTMPDVVSSESVDVLCPAGGLPLFGRRRPHSPVFVATGFCDNAFTLGTVAALVVTDLLLGRPTSWSGVFAPDFRTRAGVQWDA